MIFRAILDGIGWHSAPTPSLHNQAVHDALNIKAAALEGHARMVRLQRASDLAAAAGNTAAVARIIAKQDDVRAALENLAGRLD